MDEKKREDFIFLCSSITFLYFFYARLIYLLCLQHIFCNNLLGRSCFNWTRYLHLEPLLTKSASFQTLLNDGEKKKVRHITFNWLWGIGQKDSWIWKNKKDSHFSMPRLPSDSTSTTTKKEKRVERQEQIELFWSSLSLQYKRQNSTELPTTMKTIRQFLPTKPTASRTMTEKKAAGNTKATIVFYCWIAVIVTMATTTVPEVQ